MPNTPRPKLYDNAKDEIALAQEYHEVQVEFARLRATPDGREQSEAESIHQALRNICGEAAAQKANDLARDSTKYRVTVVGELIEESMRTLKGVGLEMPNDVGEKGDAREFKVTRDDMRHPDSGKRPMAAADYQNRAKEAWKEVFNSWESLTKWVGTPEKKATKQLTKVQRNAVNSARGMLVEAYQGLNEIKSREIVSDSLTAADLVRAKKTHIVKASGWANEYLDRGRIPNGQYKPVEYREMEDISGLGRDTLHVNPDAPRPLDIPRLRGPMQWPTDQTQQRSVRLGHRSDQKGFLDGTLATGLVKGMALGAAAWGILFLVNPPLAGISAFLALTGIGGGVMAIREERNVQKKHKAIEAMQNASRFDLALQSPAPAPYKIPEPEHDTSRTSTGAAYRTDFVERYEAERTVSSDRQNIC